MTSQPTIICLKHFTMLGNLFKIVIASLSFHVVVTLGIPLRWLRSYMVYS